MRKSEINSNELSPDEMDQLRRWLSTTPLLRLTWLEEAQRDFSETGSYVQFEDWMKDGNAAV